VKDKEGNNVGLELNGGLCVDIEIEKIPVLINYDIEI